MTSDDTKRTIVSHHGDVGIAEARADKRVAMVDRRRSASRRGFRFRQKAALAVALLIALVASGCSPLRVLSVVGGGAVRGDNAGIPYGESARHRYDYYPSEDSSDNTPVLMFVYGGGWQSGDRRQYAFVGRAFAADGIDTVIVDYRTYPDVVFPEFVKDVARAIAHVKRTLARERPLFIAGHSAGAHIGALISLNPSFLNAHGLTPCRAIAGFMGLAGPYDFLPLKEDVFKRIFPVPLRAASQPINYAEGPNPPVFVLHGRLDTRVLPRNSERLAESLRRAESAVSEIYFNDIGHARILGSVAPVLSSIVPVRRLMIEYMHRPKPRPPSTCPEQA